MIGFARSLVVDHVLEPQTLEERGETRAYLDPDSRPLDTHPQEIDLLAVSTRPLSFEIGDGMSLRHEVSVAVVVQHGDPPEAIRLRDLIVLELCLRARDAWPAIAQLVDPATGQYAERFEWAVDWRPLVVDTPNESATITFTIDTQLDG